MAFNTTFQNENLIDPLNLDEVKAIPIDHPFWDFGQLTHPGEPWATDPKVQDGFLAYLNMTHSEDELQRIGRKCRWLVNWSNETFEKISRLKEIIYSEGR